MTEIRNVSYESVIDDVSLTDEERIFISIAKAGASSETERLIKIIERLSGEDIEPADFGMILSIV